jgi:hypothetical protein
VLEDQQTLHCWECRSAKSVPALCKPLLPQIINLPAANGGVLKGCYLQLII